jgi:hypothetical protein
VDHRIAPDGWMRSDSGVAFARGAARQREDLFDRQGDKKVVVQQKFLPNNKNQKVSWTSQVASLALIGVWPAGRIWEPLSYPILHGFSSL